MLYSIVRSLSFLLIAFARNDWLLIMTSLVVWDIPSFLLVVSFSFFTFYLAKLNIEVERTNL